MLMRFSSRSLGTLDPKKYFNQEKVSTDDIEKIVKIFCDRHRFDVSIYNGQSVNDFKAKINVRADSGRCLIAIFDNDHQEIGWYDNGADRTGEKVDIMGDLWAENNICSDPEVLRSVMSDFLQGKDFSLRSDWVLWDDD